VEVIATCTVVAIAFVAIIEIFVSITTLNRQAKHLAVATQALQGKIEEYRSTAWANLPPGGSPRGCDATASFAVDLPGGAGSAVFGQNGADPCASIGKLDVTVSWTEGSRSKTIQASTLLTQRGLNR
jgi:type II secretory pathway pseudopilin PulG